MIKKIWLYIFLFFCLILNIIIDVNIQNYFNILNLCFNVNIVFDSNLYIVICSIIALISILIILDVLLVVFKKEKQNSGINFKSDDGTHGTANWMSYESMKQVLGFNDTPGIILGKYNDNVVKLPFKSYFNKNICVFGSSRKYENNRLFTNKFIGAFKI